jgi:hypothetical protein
MPLRLDTTAEQPLLLLEGIVTIEETDQLLEVLREHPGIAVDLSGCEHLHTAPLQTLKLLKVPIRALPDAPFWKFLLDPCPMPLDPQKETDTP